MQGNQRHVNRDYPCGRRDSNPHGLRPRGPKPRASTSSATPACAGSGARPARDCKVANAWPTKSPTTSGSSTRTARRPPRRSRRLIIIVLLLASAVLLAIITWGGWDTLEGAKPLQIAYIVLYLRDGVLGAALEPRASCRVASALAIIMLIFAAVSAPQWFDRDKAGFTDPTLDVSIIGPADRADGPAADPPDRVRHERLPPGVERRGRARARGRAAGATTAAVARSAPSAATPPPLQPDVCPYDGRAPCPGGGIGRRHGLKIHCPSGRAGSSPAPGIRSADTLSCRRGAPPSAGPDAP